jgi:hypothetical protein
MLADVCGEICVPHARDKHGLSNHWCCHAQVATSKITQTGTQPQRSTVAVAPVLFAQAFVAFDKRQYTWCRLSFGGSTYHYKICAFFNVTINRTNSKAAAQTITTQSKHSNMTYSDTAEVICY